jgi:uncharacterized coiled-coil protein SlyX
MSDMDARIARVEAVAASHEAQLVSLRGTVESLDEELKEFNDQFRSFVDDLRAVQMKALIALVAVVGGGDVATKLIGG